MTVKSVELNLSATNLGYNSAKPPVILQDGELCIAKNAILQGSGFVRAPGCRGIGSDPVFSAPCRGIANLSLYDGSDILIGVSDATAWRIDPATGTKSAMISTSGRMAAYFDQHANRMWCTDGGAPFKVEADGSAYRIGIQPPTEATAFAAVGGSLPVGLYDIYASYSRKIDGVHVLFSQGQYVGKVAVSGDSKTVRVLVPASDDPQVTHRVVWMSDAGGTMHYFFAEAENNSSDIDIVDTSGRNEFVAYLTEAADNSLPPDGMRSIHAFGNRLWGHIENMVYFSMQGATITGRPAHDVERWPLANCLQLPFKVVDGGIFSIGADIYFSTEGGVIVLPGGDDGQPIQFVDKYLYFKYGRTIKVERGRVWGLTNDGVRCYTPGTGFSQDMSRNIKPDIDEIYRGAADGYEPCAEIYRRSGRRTEYHLSYRDLNKSPCTMSTTLVLDLDASGEVSATQFVAPWEMWDRGFQSAATTNDGKFYRAQSTDSAGTVFVEDGVSDLHVFDNLGAMITALTPRELQVRTKTIVPDLLGVLTLEELFVLLSNGAPVNFRISGADRVAANVDRSVAASGEPVRFDEATFDQAIFPSTDPATRRVKLNYRIKGRSAWLEISQTADDPAFNLVSIELVGKLDIGGRQ
jgi:hypothetical protein